MPETNSLALYAPVLDSTIPPFTGNSLSFNFFINEALYSQIQLEKSQQKIIKIHNKIQNYYDSENVSLESDIDFPELLTSTKNGRIGSITISPSNPTNFFKNGNYYKVQIQIISSEQPAPGEPAHTEFSNTLLVKHIEEGKSQISFINNMTVGPSSILTIPLETPIFTGRFNFTADSRECVNYYKFTLLEENNSVILEESDWIKHTVLTDQYCFKYQLKNLKNYYVRYEIKSQNGYYQTLSQQIQISLNTNFRIKNLLLEIEDNNNYCLENGCIQAFLTTIGNNITNGVFSLKRTSEDSNFTQWETLQIFRIRNQKLVKFLIHTDFLVENNKKYQYTLQEKRGEDQFSSYLFERNKNFRSINFEYCFLYGENKQLCLKFNNKISSFKYNVQANKINTLGSKYPVILRNAHTYYAEFPISGLISVQMDNFNTFQKAEKNDSIDLLRLSTKASSSRKEEIFATNLEKVNINKEKAFRDQIQTFLNNGKPKLFKSPTEGNFIICLMNINFTPNQTLGRMIWDFSATAYEIAENTFTNLKNLGIYKINTLEDLSNSSSIKVFGQINVKNQEQLQLLTAINNQLKARYALDETYEYTLDQTKPVELKIELKEENSTVGHEYYFINLPGTNDPSLYINKKYPYFWSGFISQDDQLLTIGPEGDFNDILITYKINAIESLRKTLEKTYQMEIYWNQIAINNNSKDLQTLIKEQIERSQKFSNITIEDIVIEWINIEANTPVSFNLIKGDIFTPIHLNQTDQYFLKNEEELFDNISFSSIRGKVIITYKCTYNKITTISSSSSEGGK